MNKNTKTLVREYKIKAHLYEKSTNAINSLFGDILKKGGYKYHIYSRLKKKESLEKKIERKKQKGKIYKKLRDIKDISGVRVIFYTESDRKRFISEIQKEFKDSIKIKETYKVSGYRAIHAIISFGKERLKLSEYKSFKGLECEVQLCLILEHAWAEIEHDILYKKNFGVKTLDKMHYLFIKDQMERVMKNYINKASTELEDIVLQFKKIERDNKVMTE